MEVDIGEYNQFYVDVTLTIEESLPRELVTCWTS